MRFALIGESAEAAFIAESIQTASDHQLVSCCVSGTLAEELIRRGISFSLVSSPEEAIIDADTDTVVVAISDVDRATALVRQASQADRHVVVIPPDSVSTAFSYELHLLLDESRWEIVPLTGRWYLNPESPVSAFPPRDSIRLFTMDCELSADPTQQQRAQLRGIDALCGCGFQYNQVTGMDLPGADGALLSRSITLASSDSTDAGAPPATLTFRGAEGSASDANLTIALLSGESLPLPTALPAPEKSAYGHRSAELLNRIVARLSDADACQRGMENFSNTLELMAGLEKSFRRRRTIDVYFDGVSERGAFKTQMTAIGCGVLAYVTFGLVAFLVVAQLTDLPPWILKLGRWIWISPVILFLLAQLLLPLSRERGSGTDTSVDEKTM